MREPADVLKLVDDPVGNGREVVPFYVEQDATWREKHTAIHKDKKTGLSAGKKLCRLQTRATLKG